MVLFLLLAISVAIIAWIINFVLNWKVNYWTQRGVPVAQKPSLLWKFLTQDFTLAGADVDVYTQLKGKRFGGYTEFLQPVLLITDLELMKRIFIQDFDHFVNYRTLALGKNDPHFHLALQKVTGEKWKGLRSRMSTTFTTGKIRRMFLIFDASSKRMVEFINKEIQTNNEIEMRPVFQKLAMDVIASAGFGLKSNLFEDSNSSFMKMGRYIQRSFGGENTCKLLPVPLFPGLSEKLNIKITINEADRFLSKLVLDALNHRHKSNEKRDDLLQLMLESQQGKLEEMDERQLDESEKYTNVEDAPQDSKTPIMDDDLIIAQSVVFFLAGFDGMDSFFGFAIYELAVNPDVQGKLYEEVKAAADKNDGELAYDIINGLEYLDMVVSETLRMYPFGVRTERKCIKAYKVPDSELTLEAGTLVVIPTYAVHHDPEYYQNPERFDPLRFTKENISKRHPFAYQPFGHGPRSCIGNRFALSEAKSGIAQLILNFSLEPCKKTVMPIPLENRGALKPADNICLKVTSRKIN